MERHSVSRLIGAPPGYVGYEEGGQLSEAVRRKPFSVILLDEIEKAHPEVFNILLQILDDGRLTDNKGHVVNFKNTIIIMTSNIGAHLILEKSKSLKDENREELYQEIRSDIMKLLFQELKPEFLNRVDELVVFQSLSFENIKQIVDLQMARVQRQLIEKDLTIELTEKAKNYLAEVGFDVTLGARPLKRIIHKEVLDKLAIFLLKDIFQANDVIQVDFKKGQIEFSKKPVKIVSDKVA
jgi:ATP-dependent Clp protease ATP-binding subunit ClpB